MSNEPGRIDSLVARVLRRLEDEGAVGRLSGAPVTGPSAAVGTIVKSISATIAGAQFPPSPLSWKDSSVSRN